MKLFYLYFFLLICNPFLLRAQSINKIAPIIPQPTTVNYGNGSVELIIDNIVVQKGNEEIKKLAKFYATLFKKPNAPIVEAEKIQIQKAKNIYLFIVERRNEPDRYKIQVTASGIIVEASQVKGLFYALQTLTQLVELSFENTTEKIKLPTIIIEDQPRFNYRGMHLDVARHFFPVSFIKQYIDLLARFKFNTFHWHLTDDQGWRIEIKKYPELTNVGAYRKETLIGHYTDSPVKYDGKEYGGYYTQDQIKEIVQYAADRYITIIPEIEMPGHASAAIAAYPIFGCTGGPYEVQTTWGVFSDVFCTKDTTLTFLKDVLNEVCDLFPGKYIHIGGDECPKEKWKACPTCQRVRLRQNLKTEDQLQSYFIKEIEKYLNRKGKKMIGWDEILEGGLAPNATVMSWRGEKGGIEAATSKHDVVMTPGSHCYFDHYQSNYKKEALAIGGYTPISKVYQYEPIPASLDPKFHQYILGAQGNVWTEYMDNERKVIYMAFPRAMALAEALWCKPEEKNYEKFLERLQIHMPWFKTRKMALTPAFGELQYQLVHNDSGMTVKFERAPIPGKVLVEFEEGNNFRQDYPLGDSIVLSANSKLKAWYMFEDNSLCKPVSIEYNQHKAVGKSIQFIETPSPKYFSAANSIINGIKAPSNKYSGPEWIGMEGNDFNSILNLNQSQSLSQVKIQLFHFPAAWIYLPKEIKIEGSNDGKTFQTIETWKLPENVSGKYLEAEIKINKPINAQYIQITALNHGMIQQGQAGAGHKAWLFVGELTVE